MYIEDLKRRQPAKQNYRMIREPRQKRIEEHSKDVLIHWRGPEFEILERDKKWYLLVSLFLLAVICYAVYKNSPVMAITFILIGIVGYIYIEKDPRTLDFMITRDGVAAGKELYEFDNLRSFWIFYEPHREIVVSLHTKNSFSPYVHIPLHKEDPVRIREILLEYIPEEKQEPGLVETLGRLLKI